MIPTSASLQNTENTAFGDTSRNGQASGLVGNFLNLVSGKGNKQENAATSGASGSDPKSIWIYALAAGGLFVLVIALKRK